MEKQLITGDEPAMPHPVHEGRSGLSIRQHFASMAMQGMLSNRSVTDIILRYVTKGQKSTYLAQAAIEQADALIAELNK